MAILPIKVPQLGEGLEEARLLECLKQPGEFVEKDEPIFEIETDKAVTKIESPYSGTIVSWLAEIDSVLPIGAEIGTMEVADVASESASPASNTGHGATSEAPSSSPGDTAAAPPPSSSPPATAAEGKPIPPRTRKLLQEKGLEHLAHQIPAAGKQLLPDDIEAFLNSREDEGQRAAAASSAPSSPSTSDGYEERPLNPAQKTLNFRMARGAQQVLPATLEADFDWTAIDAARRSVAESGGPSAFSMFSWCVAQSIAEHPAFRSSLSSDGETLRTYRNVNLGIAVSLEGDLLATAVVRRAETLSKDGFFGDMSARIAEARGGKDQVDASTTVSVSNIGKAGMRCGIPVVVTPAVATIVVGTVRDVPVPLEKGFEFRKTVTVTMSFDHRLANGVGAADFLNAIRNKVEAFELST
ncbi:MAG: 2-oxo acid dehydrogenase subunit E2 [Planctomycetota bacterium]